MKCARTLSAIASLFCSFGIALADWENTDPENGKMRLASIGGTAEGYWTSVQTNFGANFRCESGWWESSSYSHRAEATFCWSDNFTHSRIDEGGGGYEKTKSDTFFKHYKATRHSKTNSINGPTLETAVGEVQTHAFDIPETVTGNPHKECIGFSITFERGLGHAWGLYGKYLDFYACAKNGSTISHGMFRRILSGFSIAGEFEAFME